MEKAHSLGDPSASGEGGLRSRRRAGGGLREPGALPACGGAASERTGLSRRCSAELSDGTLLAVQASAGLLGAIGTLLARGGSGAGDEAAAAAAPRGRRKRPPALGLRGMWDLGMSSGCGEPRDDRR